LAIWSFKKAKYFTKEITQTSFRVSFIILGLAQNLIFCMDQWTNNDQILKLIYSCLFIFIAESKDQISLICFSKRQNGNPGGDVTK